MKQVEDFIEESQTLAGALQALPEKQWSEKTQFKKWTLNEIIIHLHFWNRVADLSMKDPNAFQNFWNELSLKSAQSGLRNYENSMSPERGPELLAVWQEGFKDMASRWKDLDPKLRIQWAGPDMSIRSSITARQMETWAHGQAVYDLLGQVRTETDRIQNIVVLGVNTFSWSFKVHGLEVPEEMPFLKLSSPSAEEWEFGNKNSENVIQGSAVEFCWVVTQTRNIQDTLLSVFGDTALQWMSIAQCFAGPPETPPPPGSRFLL